MESTKEQRREPVLAASEEQPVQTLMEEERATMHVERTTTPDGRSLLLYSFVATDDE